MVAGLVKRESLAPAWPVEKGGEEVVTWQVNIPWQPLSTLSRASWWVPPLNSPDLARDTLRQDLGNLTTLSSSFR